MDSRAHEPLIFVAVCRKVVTWLRAADPVAAAAAPVNVAPSGGATDLFAAVERAGAFVAARAATFRSALSKIPAVAGATAIELRGGLPAQHDARDVAAAYFAEGTPSGLLGAGARFSGEQWAVANAAARGLNVLCRAVAGAGKTTTLLLCASRAPDRIHLLLTYNKRLQVDVSRRAPRNVRVMTFHGVAGKAYGGVVRNDDELRRLVRASAPENPLDFDTLFVDESQDMAVEYFALVRHLLAARPAATMVVVGDERQSINEYRGAHPGFLTEAPAVYGRPAGWAMCRLGVSHRLTPATATFVNTHLYRAPVLIGGNHRDQDRRPLYVAASGLAGVSKALAATTRELLAEFGPENIFILAPSIRKLATARSPVAELVRTHLAGVPVFVAADDGARVDEELTRGKLAILSFNAVKGCERPCVIVVGLDETYFRYYERDWAVPSPGLPNVLTVAATRASSRLVIVANSRDTVRSVDADRLAHDAEVRGKPAAPRAPRAARTENRNATAVVDLVRHLHPDVAAAAAAFLGRRALPSQPSLPRGGGRVKFGGAEGAPSLTEDLSFVYGVLGPVLAEVARRGSTAFAAAVENPVIVADGFAAAAGPDAPLTISAAEYAAYPPQFWENISAALITTPVDRSDAEWATLAVADHAIRGGHHHIARQVAHYDWVDGAALGAARDAVLRALGDTEGEFEVPLRGAAGGTDIWGQADFICGDGTVWEFKLGELDMSHDLQLGCYLALRGGGTGRLVSIRCGAVREVGLAVEDAVPFLEALVSRAAVEKRTVAQLIADFDAGLDVGAAPGGGGGAADPDAPLTGAADVDDLYG